MGRRAKQTLYRKQFAGKKLNEHLSKELNPVELRGVYQTFIGAAREERKARLLNNADIVKQLNKFLSLIEDKVDITTDIIDFIAYKELLLAIKEEMMKLEAKGRGGIQASNTRKINLEAKNYTEWYELPIHGFSVNFMYSVGKSHKMVKSEAYATWREKFPHHLVPSIAELSFNGIDLTEPLGIECEFIAKEKFDVDNFSKSLIDAIWENYGNDDNGVVETKCKRIGTCERYGDGLIRFRIYNA